MSDYTLKYRDSFNREIEVCTIRTIRAMKTEYGVGLFVVHVESRAHFLIRPDGLYYEVLCADEFGVPVYQQPVTWGHPTLSACIETLAEMVLAVQERELWEIARFN